MDKPKFVSLIAAVSLVLIALAGFARAGSIFDDTDIPAKPADRSRPADQNPSPTVPVKPSDSPVPPSPETVTPTPGPSEKPISPDAGSPRQTIPGKADLMHSRQLLKVAFAEQLKDKSIPARRKLAESLLEESDKSGNSPADRFALLTGAIDAAREGISLPLCARAAEKLAGNFSVDDLKVETNAAEAMNFRSAAPADASDNVGAGLELVNSLAEAEEFTDAAKVLSLVRPLAASNPELHAAVARRTQSLEATRAASDRTKPAIEKLKTAPTDPAANQVVGNYYCFRLGQWEKGLPYLGRGSDAHMKHAVGEELAAGADVSKAMSVADAWWDAAIVKGVPENEAKAMKVHAATWYRIAKRNISGLEAKAVDTRLHEAAAILSDGDGPVGSGGGGVGPSTLVNSFGMKFVRISPGWFIMGSPLNEAQRANNEKQHKVMLTHPYYMQTMLITNGQWKAVMDGDRSALETELTPRASVSWNAAMSFCRKLSDKEGKQYRLPTEAEWEYACRAGSPTPYGAAKVDDVAWYSGNASGATHPVGKKKANAWGLYDMHGQVWEWCSDFYGEYPDGAIVDPTGPALTDEKSQHVHRGGSWDEGSDRCRSASREGGNPNYGDDRYGFRICLDPTP